MDRILSTLAFALLIGAWFLAAIVLISRRKAIYADSEERVRREDPQSDPAREKVVEEGRPANAM